MCKLQQLHEASACRVNSTFNSLERRLRQPAAATGGTPSARNPQVCDTFATGAATVTAFKLKAREEIFDELLFEDGSLASLNLQIVFGLLDIDETASRNERICLARYLELCYFA
jgi:hypothetical protein